MLRSKLAHYAVVVTVSLCLAPIAGAQQIGYLFNQYGGPGTYNFWNNRALAQGDFNRDGRIDFVVSQETQTSYPAVGIYLAQSDGTYQLSQTIQLSQIQNSGAFLNTLAVGDLNGDGISDIVGVNSMGDVYALLGNGDGTFRSPVLTSEGQINPWTMTIGDFNGDGYADLAVTEDGENEFFVMLGNGDGTFSAPAIYAAPTTVAIVAADLNGDGKLDLAAGTGNSVSIFLGVGDGTFQSPSSYSLNGGAQSLAIADMNGDKRLDLVVGTAFNTGLSVLLGNGDGTFQPATFTVGTGTNYGRAMVTGDFNGDGKTDVAIAGDTLGTEVFLGNGLGGFKANPQTYGPQLAWDGPNLIVAGDYNLDGKLDLAVLPIVSPLPFEIFANNGDGTFLSGRTLNAGKGTYGVLSGDFNRDNKSDLVAINNGSKNVSVFLGNGNGTFQAAKAYAVGVQPQSGVVGDFNGDGYPDLAIANYGDGTISILLNNANGTFQNQVKYSVGSFPAAIAAADLRNIGKLDLVVGSGSGLKVLLGNGDGTFQAATSYGTGAYGALAIADFNGDGNMDVVDIDGPEFELSLFFGNGDGGFGLPQLVSYFPIDGVQSVAAGNLRGSGIQDIVVGGSCCGATLGVLLNNGDGTFQRALQAGTTAIGQASSVILADVNGDGALDAIASGNPGMTILQGDGIGDLIPNMVWYGASGLGTGTGVAPNGVAVADFNGDGSLDVAAVENKGSSVAGALSLFFSNPVAVFSSSSLNFGSVNVGSNSELNLTLTNQSGTTLTISSMSITGGGATDYSQTSTCGISVSPYTNCTVAVTFTPAKKGTFKASLKLTDSAVGPARTISLSGTGR